MKLGSVKDVIELPEDGGLQTHFIRLLDENNRAAKTNELEKPSWLRERD